MYPSTQCHQQTTVQCLTNSSIFLLTLSSPPSLSLTSPFFRVPTGLPFPARHHIVGIMQHLPFQIGFFSVSNVCHFLCVFPCLCADFYSLSKNKQSTEDTTRFLKSPWQSPSFSSYTANVSMQLFMGASVPSPLGTQGCTHVSSHMC